MNLPQGPARKLFTGVRGREFCELRHNGVLGSSLDARKKVRKNAHVLKIHRGFIAHWYKEAKYTFPCFARKANTNGKKSPYPPHRLINTAGKKAEAHLRDEVNDFLRR